jgi:hypothetical protein
MALKIVYRLIAIQNAKRPKDANIKTFDMTEDTFANRDAALTAIGWPNTSGKDPDVTIKKFTKSMKDTASVEKITVFPLLIDDVTNKAYMLREVDPADYLQYMISTNIKEIREKERILWHKDLGDRELDLEENYEKRDRIEKSKSATSVSASTTSTSISG